MYELNFIDPQRELVKGLRLFKKRHFLIELDETMFQSTKEEFYYPLKEEIENLISNVKKEGLPIDNLLNSYNEFNKRPEILELALTKSLSEDEFMEFAQVIVHEEKRINMILELFDKRSENQRNLFEILFR